MLEAVWQIWIALAPWLLLGAVIAGALYACLPPGLLKRRLAGPGGVMRAVLLGVPLPLCSCGVIPTGLGLKKQGVGDGATVGFLISTPQTGVDSVLVTAAMLGWPLALWKVVIAAATGLLGGWWAYALQELPPEASESQDQLGGDANATRSLAAAASHAVEMLRSTWRWVLVGVLISAALTVWLPVGGLGSLSDYGGLTGMLAALALSLPMYLCATASVPIAASLVAAGLPAGAAIVLLMAGPATNAATIGAVYRTLGGRMLTVYLTAIAAGSITGGLAFEWLAIASWDSASTAHDHALHANAAGWWSVTSGWVLAAGFVWFAVDDARRLLAPRQTPTGSTTAVAVEGMSCGGCVAKLEQAVAADPSVGTVRVTLEPGRVEVGGSISIERLKELVRAAGFSPAP